MFESWGFAALAGVTVFAATIQAATGFGFALLAVPFFLMVMGSLSAIQVAAVVNLVISLVLLPGLLNEIPRRLLLHLIAGSVAGFPVGLWLFRAADLQGTKLAIGVLITAFTCMVAAREFRRGRSEPAAVGAIHSMKPIAPAELAVGFLSGIMGVALAMPGPVVVLYLAARRAGKQISRPATLLLFLFSYGAISLVHTIWGGMTQQAWWTAGKLVPFVIMGALLGHFVSRHLNEVVFRTVVLLILLGSGLFAIWTAF